jgi:serine protease Do
MLRESNYSTGMLRLTYVFIRATLLICLFSLCETSRCFAQADAASEPAVLAIAKVLPAVVNINTERIVKRQVRDPFEDFAAQFFGNYRGRPREVRQTLQSLGSGFLVDPAGYVITNEHVVARAADLKIEVTTNDGKTYRAHYITGDEKKDLAFIKIDAKEAFPFINLDNISPNLLGETVLVVGNALGYGSSISRGVLSGMKRDITVDNIEYKNLVQTDAAINRGNSGGPLINTHGEVIGINSAIYTPSGTTAGIGFAIPVNTAKRIARDLITDGRVHQAFIGVETIPFNESFAEALGLPAQEGLLVQTTTRGGPAAEAGEASVAGRRAGDSLP